MSLDRIAGSSVNLPIDDFRLSYLKDGGWPFETPSFTPLMALVSVILSIIAHAQYTTLHSGTLVEPLVTDASIHVGS